MSNAPSTSWRPAAISFYALPTSKNIRQDFAMRTSTICIEEQARAFPFGFLIISVSINGQPLWSRPVGTTSVEVYPPLLQQGERVEVRCMLPEPLQAPQTVRATYPLPDLSYGLTAPVQASQRHCQRSDQQSPQRSPQRSLQ